MESDKQLHSQPLTDLIGLFENSPVDIGGEQNQWIHYSDQLPPLTEDVLFCCEDENGDFQYVRVGWYEGQKTLGEAIAMETLDGEPNAWYPCTHWMPLPKPPIR